ncbi:helix-turn-helix transcriptional regulator [Pseudomonas sp. B21-023]|nr:helix-turn-helix transcriptional regulator [Pseudomonas sp. B21-023]NQD77560.1 helix-turn-helix transcriptional regulator [Pseudomonas sp. CM27]UVM14373.1 helix-turn-helix transcriptional regulator [Pseudomonas sp. B21-023]
MHRKAFASALRFLRRQGSVLQADFDSGVSQSHVSRLEQGQSSPTLDRLEEIAAQLGLHPITLVAITCGASEQIPPAQLLERVRRELEAVASLDQPLPIEDQPITHPQIIEARKLRDEVQRLKGLGHTKAEISRLLGIAKSTAAKHWQ